MNPFRALETTISNLVEGTFGRVFRSEVRPMELARRLTREMDANRTASVSRVYAPNEYVVLLSPPDRALYEGVEDELIDELCAYLLEHARREDLMLASPPLIVFHTDERLSLGEFGVETKLTRPGDQESVSPDGSQQRGEPAALDQDELPPGISAPVAAGRAVGAEPGAIQEELPAERGETMIYSSSQRVGGPPAQARARRVSTRALLLVEGKRLLVPPPGAVLGRSRECDVVLEDSGVSRRHAEIRPSSTGWTITDLGSTNGVRVNGQAIQGAQSLALGDRIELGSLAIVFEVR
jgi:hypothetical protein